MNAIYRLNGVKCVLEVFEDRVAITRQGVFGSSQTKEIPFQSIVAIQFMEDKFLGGYIRFTTPGGKDVSAGFFSTVDENTVQFAGKKSNAIAIEIKEYIDSALHRLRTSQTSSPATNLVDELQKLARLKEQGILSDEEFQAAKKKLIG